MGVRLFPAVHGYIADSDRDHEPGPGGRIALDEEAEGVVLRTACFVVAVIIRLCSEVPKRTAIVTGSRTGAPDHPCIQMLTYPNGCGQVTGSPSRVRTYLNDAERP